MRTSPLVSLLLSGFLGSYLANVVTAVEVQKETVENYQFTPVKLHFGQKDDESVHSTVILPLATLYRIDVTETHPSGRTYQSWQPLLLRGKVPLDEESTGIAGSDSKLFGEDTDVRGEMYFDGGPLYKSVRCVFLDDANADSSVGKGVRVSVADDQSFAAEEWQTVPGDAEAVECVANYTKYRIGWAAGRWMRVEN